jgi:hypothetical protein
VEKSNRRFDHYRLPEQGRQSAVFQAPHVWSLCGCSSIIEIEVVSLPFFANAMTRIIVDSDLLARLHGLGERLEFCDESGRTLGVFQPAPAKLAPGEGVDGSPFTREQLEEFRKQRTGRPLADILRDLERSV